MENWTRGDPRPGENENQEEVDRATEGGATVRNETAVPSITRICDVLWVNSAVNSRRAFCSGVP